MLIHYKVWTLSLIASAITLSACQPKQAEQKQEEQENIAQVQEKSQQLIGDTEQLNLNLPECSGNICPEINIERLQSNQAFIDEKIDAEIVKQLEHILSIVPFKESSNAVTASASELMAQDEPVSQPKGEIAKVETAKIKLEKKSAPYLQQFLALDQELKALSSSHEISILIKPKILNAKEPLATVVLDSSSYLGGAHGSSSQQYYNFDIQTHKLVTLNEIIKPHQREALKQKAYAAFKQWVVDMKLADDIKDYEEVWKFKLSDNYYLGKDGLILQYGEYEIGPYVVGLPRLTIPYDQLSGILKPAYLPKADVSSVKKTANKDKNI